MQHEYLTNTPLKTKKLGEKMAKEIIKKPLRKTAFVIGLEGELGGGKTTFLQGFAKGLGIKEKILSPTFVIIKKFQVPLNCEAITSPPKFCGPKFGRERSGATGSCFKFQEFYHIDCYRIKKLKDLLDLGLKKIISNPKNIVAVEWTEQIRKILPKDILILRFEFIDEKTRKIIFSPDFHNCEREENESLFLF